MIIFTRPDWLGNKQILNIQNVAREIKVADLDVVT